MDDSISIQSMTIAARLGATFVSCAISLLKEAADARRDLRLSQEFRERINTELEKNGLDSVARFEHNSLEDAKRAEARFAKEGIVSSVIQMPESGKIYTVVLSDDAVTAKRIMDEHPRSTISNDRIAFEQDCATKGTIQYSFAQKEAADLFEEKCKGQLAYERKTDGNKHTMIFSKTPETERILASLEDKTRDRLYDFVGLQYDKRVLEERYKQEASSKIREEIHQPQKGDFYVIDADNPSIPALHVTAGGAALEEHGEKSEISVGGCRGFSPRGTTDGEKSVFAYHCEKVLKAYKKPVTMTESQYEKYAQQQAQSLKCINHALTEINTELQSDKESTDTSKFVCIVSKTSPTHRMMFDGKTFIYNDGRGNIVSTQPDSSISKNKVTKLARDAAIALGSKGDAISISKKEYDALVASEKKQEQLVEEGVAAAQNGQKMTFVSLTTPSHTIEISPDSYTVSHYGQTVTVSKPKLTDTKEDHSKGKTSVEKYYDGLREELAKSRHIIALPAGKELVVLKDLKEKSDKNRYQKERLTLGETKAILGKHGVDIKDTIPFDPYDNNEKVKAYRSFNDSQSKYVNNELFKSKDLTKEELEKTLGLQQKCRAIALAFKDDPAVLAARILEMRKAEEARKLYHEKESIQNGTDRTANDASNAEVSFVRYVAEERDGPFSNTAKAEALANCAFLDTLSGKDREIVDSYFTEYTDKCRSPHGVFEIDLGDISSSYDRDTDGDGIRDEDDPTPFGEEERDDIFD